MKNIFNAVQEHRNTCVRIRDTLDNLSVGARILGLTALCDDLSEMASELNSSSYQLTQVVSKDLDNNFKDSQKEVKETLTELLKAATYPNRDNG